jgi:hypothetical protein
MIQIDLRGVEMNSFELLEPGVYTLKVAKTEEKKSAKGNPMVVITWEEEVSGITVFDYLAFTDGTRPKVKSLLYAINQPCGEEVYNVDPMDWRGERASCKVGVEEYLGSDNKMHKKNKVQFYNRIENGAAVAKPAQADPIDDVPF